MIRAPFGPPPSGAQIEAAMLANNDRMWWSGIPGQYVRMGRLDGSNGWVIEGWTPLPSTIPTP